VPLSKRGVRGVNLQASAITSKGNEGKQSLNRGNYSLNWGKFLTKKKKEKKKTVPDEPAEAWKNKPRRPRSSRKKEWPKSTWAM